MLKPIGHKMPMSKEEQSACIQHHISTCLTPLHLVSCGVMVENFHNTHKDDNEHIKLLCKLRIKQLDGGTGLRVPEV